MPLTPLQLMFLVKISKPQLMYERKRTPPYSFPLFLIGTSEMMNGVVPTSGWRLLLICLPSLECGVLGNLWLVFEPKLQIGVSFLEGIPFLWA